MSQIRRLHAPDVEAYRRIRLDSLSTDPDYFGSTFEEEASLPMTDFADRLASSAVFGAWAGDAIVGTMLFRRETRPKESHKAVVHGVFVTPSWRGRGLAASLLAALIEAARADVEQLTLTVMRGNPAAIALYERFGFVTYGIEPRARKMADGYADNVLMALIF